jgi:hypothetical protein
VSGSGYDGDNEVSGEEESVQNAQSVDVAGVVTITPNLAKGDDEFSDDEEIVVCCCTYCFAFNLFYCLLVFYPIGLLFYRF